MTTNPDADVMYDEAIALQARVEALELASIKFYRLTRDKELELLSNGYLIHDDPEVRMEGLRLRVNQILEEEHKELFEFIDGESAAIKAMRMRNDAIVAAGWAENFNLNSMQREFYATEKKRELEQ